LNDIISFGHSHTEVGPLTPFVRIQCNKKKATTIQRKNQTKLTLLNPKKNKQFKKKNQGKNQTKLTLKKLNNFLLKICPKIFWKRRVFSHYQLDPNGKVDQSSDTSHYGNKHW
jgi:hypothetical protein